MDFFHDHLDPPPPPPPPAPPTHVRTLSGTAPPGTAREITNQTDAHSGTPHTARLPRRLGIGPLSAPSAAPPRPRSPRRATGPSLSILPRVAESEAAPVATAIPARRRMGCGRPGRPAAR